MYRTHGTSFHYNDFIADQQAGRSQPVPQLLNVEIPAVCVYKKLGLQCAASTFHSLFKAVA